VEIDLVALNRVMRASRDERDLQFIAHVLDNVEEMALFQQWSGST
jgi:hypothetical protein